MNQEPRINVSIPPNTPFSKKNNSRPANTTRNAKNSANTTRNVKKLLTPRPTININAPPREGMYPVSGNRSNLPSEMEQLIGFKEQSKFEIHVQSISHGRTETLQIESREMMNSVLPRVCALFGVNPNDWDLVYEGKNLTGTKRNFIYHSKNIKELYGIKFFDGMTFDLVKRPTKCFGFTCKRPNRHVKKTRRHRRA